MQGHDRADLLFNHGKHALVAESQRGEVRAPLWKRTKKHGGTSNVQKVNESKKWVLLFCLKREYSNMSCPLRLTVDPCGSPTATALLAVCVGELIPGSRPRGKFAVAKRL